MVTCLCFVRYVWRFLSNWRYLNINYLDTPHSARHCRRAQTNLVRPPCCIENRSRVAGPRSPRWDMGERCPSSWSVVSLSASRVTRTRPLDARQVHGTSIHVLERRARRHGQGPTAGGARGAARPRHWCFSSRGPFYYYLSNDWVIHPICDYALFAIRIVDTSHKQHWTTQRWVLDRAKQQRKHDVTHESETSVVQPERQSKFAACVP